MSVRLGKPEFSPVEDFPEITGNWEIENTIVYFLEAKIIKLGNGYAFCMVTSRIDSILSDNGEHIKACWIAHNKEYEVYSWEARGKVKTQPSQLERVFCKYLESDGKKLLDMTFQGKLYLFAHPGNLSKFESGEYKHWDTLIDYQPCEPNLLKDADLKLATGNKRSSSNYSQSQAEKLAERQAFLVNAAGAYGEDTENLITLAQGISQFEKDNPRASEIFWRLVELIFKG